MSTLSIVLLIGGIALACLLISEFAKPATIEGKKLTALSAKRDELFVKYEELIKERKRLLAIPMDRTNPDNVLKTMSLINENRDAIMELHYRLGMNDVIDIDDVLRPSV